VVSRVLTGSGLVILAAIALLGAIILIGIGKTVPENLWTVVYILVGAGAGVAQPPTSQSVGTVTKP
jgi:hypothetical protein